MLNKNLKFDLRRPKAFEIKETDSLKKIDGMQRELKNNNPVAEIV